MSNTLADLRRDESIQYALRDAHWKAPESSKALGLAEAMQAALKALSNPQVIKAEETK